MFLTPSVVGWKKTKTKKRFFGPRHTSQTFHDQCPEFQVGYDVPVRRWSCVAMWSHRRGVQKLGNKQCCMPIGPQKARNSSETDGQGRYQEIRLRDNIFFQNPTNEDHNNDYYLKQRVPLHQSQGTTGMNLLNGAAIGRAEASEIYCYSPPLPDRTPDNWQQPDLPVESEIEWICFGTFQCWYGIGQQCKTKLWFETSRRWRTPKS